MLWGLAMGSRHAAPIALPLLSDTICFCYAVQVEYVRHHMRLAEVSLHGAWGA